MKKYSFLGLTLVAASAVVAAMLPSKAETKFAGDGVKIADLSGVGFTCRNQAGTKNCDITADTSHTLNAATTTAGGTTSL